MCTKWLGDKEKDGVKERVKKPIPKVNEIHRDGFFHFYVNTPSTQHQPQ